MGPVQDDGVARRLGLARDTHGPLEDLIVGGRFLHRHGRPAILHRHRVARRPNGDSRIGGNPTDALLLVPIGGPRPQRREGLSHKTVDGAFMGRPVHSPIRHRDDPCFEPGLWRASQDPKRRPASALRCTSCTPLSPVPFVRAREGWQARGVIP